MTREQVLASLTDLLETSPALTGTEELSALSNWDSMAVISFMSMADERFGITLAPDKVNSCRTVNDLVALVLA